MKTYTKILVTMFLATALAFACSSKKDDAAAGGAAAGAAAAAAVNLAPVGTASDVLCEVFGTKDTNVSCRVRVSTSSVESLYAPVAVQMDIDYPADGLELTGFACPAEDGKNACEGKDRTLDTGHQVVARPAEPAEWKGDARLMVVSFTAIPDLPLTRMTEGKADDGYLFDLVFKTTKDILEKDAVQIKATGIVTSSRKSCQLDATLGAGVIQTSPGKCKQ